MKRFLVIFAICFASVIGIFGGVYGIKLLKGDFKEVIVNPENISFELAEYDVTGDFKILISTTTENVNANKITLTFEKGTSYNTYGKDYITDGVIIIPKQVTLGQAFDVRLFRTNDDELGGIEWIKGGISNLVATSECITTPKATTKVCVDVPVYETKIVLFGGEPKIVSTDDYTNYLTYIEGQETITEHTPISFNAGDTFYLGLKFYPERSAYKYSKLSSSNMLVEYQSQIMQKLTELDLDYTSKFNALQKLFISSSDTIKLSFDELINTYSQIINLSGATGTSKEAQFAQYLTTLNNEFNKNLKYYTVEENAINERNYINKLERVAGTNLYRFQATTDSASFSNQVDVQLYAYAFFNSLIEDNTLLATSDYNSLLITLENLFSEQGETLTNKKVDKTTIDLSIVDVDVDTVEIAGQINDFSTNKIHTIYASQNGTNSATTSYLDIKLSNSNIATVDLQNKILNVGIRFEKRLSSTTWGDAIEIKFVDEQNYTKVKYKGDDNTYYLPLGNSSTYVNSYWQIYSDEYIANDLRAVLVYFKAYTNNGEENEATKKEVKLVADNPVFRFIDANANEQSVKWTSTDDLTIGVVDMTGVIDLSQKDLNADGTEKTTSVSYNKEVDLSKLVSIPESNNFQTYKFFLYTDEQENGKPISSYFYTTGQESKAYTFSGITKYLYELDGNILKLKGSAIPEYSVNVIFATIKTDALRNPLLNDDDTYKIAKYSAVKNSLVENLSSLSVNFTNSVSTLSGVVDENKIKETVAGVAEDGTFKMAQSSSSVLTITVNGGTGNAQDVELIKEAILNNTLKIEAREDKNNLTNYISFKAEQEEDNCYFTISTLSVLKDTNVRLYLVYNIDGNDYLFPVVIKVDKKDYYTATIVQNPNSKAYFDFEISNGSNTTSINIDDVEYINIITTYVEETKKFDKICKVKYKTSTTEQNVTIFEQNSNKIKVRVVNFLGDEITENLENLWFLTSLNTNVISIQDNQYLSFVGSSNKEVTLSLYLGNVDNSEFMQEVNFKVESSGYVSKVEVQGTEQNYDNNNNKYTFPKQTLRLTRTTAEGNNTIDLKELLKLYYYIDDEKQIPMEIRVANQASLDTLNAIGQYFNGDASLTPTIDTALTSFTMQKNLGSVISLDLIYSCSDLGITQVVSLKLEQIVSISTLKITNKLNDSEIKQTDSKYEVYTGITYKVEFNTLKVSNGTKFYWYDDIYNIQKETSIIDKDGNSSFDFIFPDSTKKNGKIHIISSNNCETGDLDYILDLTIKNNVVLNVQGSVKTTMLSGNTAKIYLKDLFARKEASGADFNNSKLVYTDISFVYGSEYAQDNKKINNIVCSETDINNAGEDRYLTITLSAFNDSLDISFNVMLDGVKIGDTINIKIVPQNLQKDDNRFALYNGQKAIVLSNGDTISSDNDVHNCFTDMFVKIPDIDKNPSISYDDKFNGTYTIKDGDTRTVITSSSDLFTDTDSYVYVTKDEITSKYLIVISSLSFPFVEFKDNENNTLPYSDLDIYYLFENTVDLCDYYENTGIGYFTTNSNDLTLFGEGEDGIFNNKIFNPIINDANFTDYGSLEMAKGDDLASNYAQLSTQDNKNIILTTKPVGVVDGVYLKVFVKLAQKGTSIYYNVPIVVHLPQTQILDVYYPNSEVYSSTNTDGYGSDAYDQEKLTETLLPFTNKYMEYVKFAENGKATLDLVGGKFNRFKVQKLDGANYVDDDSYNAGFTFSIEKIVKNVSGVWYEVDKSDFINYASIVTENGVTTLRINKYLGLDIVRLKLKITTEGSAYNYYYVSAGEVEEFTLMRQEFGKTPLSIGSTDNITLKSKESILIGAGPAQTAGEEYYCYYYLSNLNYNSELKFRVVKDGKVVELKANKENDYVKVTDNKVTMQVQPLGATFTIEIYTSYGVLSSINVTISPAYEFVFVGDILYSGTEYSRDNIFTISSNINLATYISAINVIDDSNLYTCDANKFTFGHIAQEQTFNMQLNVTVDGNNFDITFNNVKLLPRIIINPDISQPFIDNSSDNLTTYTLDNGIININKEILKKLFKDKINNGEINFGYFNDLEFYVDNKPWDDISLNYACEIGAIIDTIKPKMQFIIKSNGTVIASAYALITINPQYEVILNYPVTISSTTGEEVKFECEYVQSGGKINFTDLNFNDSNRIIVTENTTGSSVTDYKVIYDGNEVSGDFIFEHTSNEEYTDYEFDIVINNLTYRKYVVKVGNNSPFSFTPKQETIYVSYGDDDLFGNVDVIVTLPTISSLNVADIINLYVADKAGVSDSEIIARDIYYRAGEKVRAVLNLSKYKKGTSKVFVRIGTAVSETDVECIAEFNVRGELTYIGNNVRCEDYSRIISTINLTSTDITKTFVNNECEIKNIGLKSNTNIVKDEYIANNLFVKYIYDISFDSDLLSGDDEPKITLNANERAQGHSFVDLINLRDDLGNTFWYNNISSKKIMNLQVLIATGIINCLPLDPQIKDGKIYDYMLKPVGASNAGTIATLTFTYSSGITGVDEFQITFKIKILSDIEYVLYNNDGTATQNSKSNPLKVTYNTNKVLIVSAQQTNYIYAYSKYAKDPKPNLVQNWADPDVSGDTDFFTIIKEDNKLYLHFYKSADFGNKKLTVKFTDPYGFTFTYYIELIATIGVSTVSLDPGKVFEGDQIYVYNKNSIQEDDRGKTGISITLVDKDGSTNTVTGFTIMSVTFRKNGTSYSIINSYSLDNIKFSYLSFGDIWNESTLSNGLSFTGKLEISVIVAGKSLDSEKHYFEVPFTIYKRYSSEITSQNTFVRENVPINLAHFIDVYDYKQESYLGRPILTELEEISSTINLGEVIVTIDNTGTKLNDFINEQMQKIIIADQYLNDENSTDEAKNNATEAKNGAINDLKQYGIMQRSSDVTDLSSFQIYLQIKAKHKTSSRIITKEQSFDIGSTGHVNVNITLGKDTLFGPSVTALDYNFEYWLFDISKSEAVSNGKIATTIESEAQEGDANNSKVKKITTGSLYNLKITNSSEISTNISITLTVVDSSYPDGTEVSLELTKGPNNIYLDRSYVKVSLFTGTGTDGTTYVNGLSDDYVMLSKNIDSGGIYNIGTQNYSEDLSYTAKIKSETLSPDEDYGINYQSISLKYMLNFLGFDSDNNRFETRDIYSLFVTPTYTGIDTTNAYSPSIHYCYTNLNINKENGLINENTTINLETWSQGFELKAGVGVSAILAESEDKTFNSTMAKDKLIFKPGNVISTSGGATDNNSFTINTGDTNKYSITLINNSFKPNEYYISILVYCKYGAVKANGTYNETLLDTIYIQFVDVDEVEIKKQANDQYTLNIEAYKGTQTISVEDISLGLAKTISLVRNTVTFDDKGINSINHGRMYLLKVGTHLQYVRLNVCSISAENLTIEKSGNLYYISSGNMNNIKFTYDGVTKPLNDEGLMSVDETLSLSDGTNTFDFTYIEVAEKDGDGNVTNTYYRFECSSTKNIEEGVYIIECKDCSCRTTVTIAQIIT